MNVTDRELRFGVIGCGGMARAVHCPNMATIPGTRLAAYCDIDEAKAQKLLATHGGQYVTTDANRIIDDGSLDAVLIQVGPSLHPQLVQQAARAGKHIFVEKPLAVDLADALATVRAVRSAKVKFVIGLCNRLAPHVRRAKRLCPCPLYSFAQCSDTITHQACHNLDLAVNLFHEAALVSVYASGGQHWDLDPHLPADSFSAVLTFADGSVHTYIQHGKAYNALLKKYHFQLFGRDGCVYLAKRFKECHYMKAPNAVEQSWIFEGHDMDRGPNGYMGHWEQLKELVDCIRSSQGDGTMTVRDGAYVLAVEKAILASVQTRQVVDFSAFLREHDAEMLIARN